MTTIGLPAETKIGEQRVALVPSGVALAVEAGYDVWVEHGAGHGAGYTDEEYVAVGARLVDTAAQAWSCDIVTKVKEPQPSEFEYLREDLTLFAYLHLAAEPLLTSALLDSGTHAYAFETVQDRTGLPLLAPMSEVAGRTAAIVAAHTLSTHQGGRGVLAGGAAGAPVARAVVIGLGVAGTMAARGLVGLDAEVVGVDVDVDRLRSAALDGTVHSTLASEPAAVARAIADADIVIGAALVPGARAPEVVSKKMVKGMQPGAVIVDLAIDQGGCVATARPTTHDDPTYVEHGVVHYCVTNVPGQFPRTASGALSAVVAPRLVALADDPTDSRLTGALNVRDGMVVHPALQPALAYG